MSSIIAILGVGFIVALTIIKDIKFTLHFFQKNKTHNLIVGFTLSTNSNRKCSTFLPADVVEIRPVQNGLGS